MFHHQAAVLDHLDAGLCQLFRDFIVAYARLKTDRCRLLCQEIFQMPVDVVGSSKDVHQIDFIRDVDQPTLNLFSQNLGDLRIVNRNGNDFEAGSR